MNTISQSGSFHKTDTSSNSISSTPLSDSICTPPLTQSTNSSTTTSQSPPQLSTPPHTRNSQYTGYAASDRSRTRSRYPTDLARRPGNGRTPLHRRGTSQKYEPFEDLLREAGYKETRIFTPETERIAEEKGSSGKSKVAGVVGFLSGFIPGSRSTSMKEGAKKDHYSPPSSPTPSPRRNPRQNLDSEIFDEDATPKASRTYTVQPPKMRSKMASEPSNAGISASSSKQMPLPPPPRYNDATLASGRPSRATAYLRHIASVPDMPNADLQRSNSTPVSSRNHRRRAKRKSSVHHTDDEDDDFNSVYEGRTRGNGEGEEDIPPPLPKTWLETVARAVLFGSGSASSSPGATLRPPEMASSSRAVSQPNSNNPSSLSLPYGREMSPALRQLRQTRSVISRTRTLADAYPPSTAPGKRHQRQYHHNNHSLTRTQSARSALSSRSGLSDRTNRSHWATATPSPLGGFKSASIVETSIRAGAGHRPRPTLISRFDGSSRSGTSEGEIRRTRVVCRSAPASRTGSPNPSTASSIGRRGSVRRRHGLTEELQRGRQTGAKGKSAVGSSKSKSKSKSQSRSAALGEEPPSLSRVMIELEEGEDALKWFPPSPHSHPQRQSASLPDDQDESGLGSSGWGFDSFLTQSSASLVSSPLQEDYNSDGTGHFQVVVPPYSISVTDTSDEEGNEFISGEEGEESSENDEVNLDKMLRPKPLRQQSNQSTSSLRSIKSLRKFLLPPVFGGSTSASTSDAPPVPPLPPFINNNSLIETTPPATGRWSVDGLDTVDRYGSRSGRGKRGSLPNGWTGFGE